MNIRSILLMTFVLILSTQAHAAYTAHVSEDDGLPVVEENGTILVSSSYVFWGKDWSWTNQATEFSIDESGHYSTQGTNEALGFQLDSEVSKGDHSLSWDFSLEAKSSKRNIIGGGIVFELDQATLDHSSSAPKLLPGNTGWSWNGMEIRFKPAMADIHIEQEKYVRAFFYDGSVHKGQAQYTMTLSLSDDAIIKPTQSERFSSLDSQSWPETKVDWRDFGIDLSFLNLADKPAGKRGFIRAEGDQLVFEDGTVAKFWGANVSAYSLFRTTKANIKKQAQRLSKMGFNLIRLHHHDSPWVEPNIFGDSDVSNTQSLSESSIDKLDYWVASLKAEGIYVWLDLHVQRSLRRGDKIFAYDELVDWDESREERKRGVEFEGFNYVNETIKDAMKKFNHDYVTHINPYTKLAYKDEPAIVAMLLTNENDVTHHYGNSLLPDKDVPRHSKKYMALAETFAESNDLDVDRTWRSWEHGPSKLFLNDLEHRFFIELIDHLRTLGVKVPIVTTSTWGRNSLSSLPSLTAGDIIDVHSYGETLELERNPIARPNISTWMAAGQVSGKPMSVTEWNTEPFLAQDRHTSPLLIASKAGHQGWDALMHYTYSQNALNETSDPDSWNTYNDPAILPLLPAAAILYRQGHVEEANSVYVLTPGPDLFNEDISPITSAAIRTSSEIGKLLIAMPQTKALPWLEASTVPENAIKLDDFKASLLDANSTSVRSDTGELYRSWEEGIYTISTPQSQVAMGWLGGKTIVLPDAEISLETTNATVAIQSLDGRPINASSNILVSLGLNAVTENEIDYSRVQFYLSQAMKGALTIRAPKDLDITLIDLAGKRRKVSANYVDGKYLIDFNELPMAHWLVLEK